MRTLHRVEKNCCSCNTLLWWIRTDDSSLMELLNYKNRDSSIPKRDPKENIPDGSQRQEKKLSNMCRRQDTLLAEERVAKIGHVAVGEWRPDEGNVEVIIEKGKFWKTMGFHKADKKWLRPFEALYLLEISSLDLLFCGITLSVQEAYHVLLPKMVSVEYYQVYSYLMRLGYIIDEHKGFTFTDQEYRRCFNRYCVTQDQAVKKVRNWFQQIDPAPHTSNVCVSDSSPDNTKTGTNDATKSAKEPAESSNWHSKINSLENPLQGGDDVRSSNSSEGKVQEDETRYSVDPDRFYVTKLQSNVKAEASDTSSSQCCHSSSERVSQQGDCRTSKAASKLTKSDVKHSSVRRSSSENKLSDQATKPLGRSRLSAPIHKSKSKSLHLQRDTNTLKRKLAKVGPSKASLQSSYNIDDVTNCFEPSKRTLYDIGDVIDTILPAFEDADGQALPEKKMKPNLDYTPWNFKEICLPNLTEKEGVTATVPMHQLVLAKILSPRQSSLQKENLDKSQQLSGTSKKEMRSSRSFWDPEATTCDLGTEPQLSLSNIDSPRNWGEYKLVKKEDEDMFPLLESPMSHIWEGEVHPLIKPSDARATSNLLYKLQTIQNANVASHFTESCELAQDIKIDFNIYLPESNYKKSSPGKPIIYVIVTKLQEEPPSLLTQIQLLRQSGSTPLVWAVVDNGDVSFYTLRDIELPEGIST